MDHGVDLNRQGASPCDTRCKWDKSKYLISRLTHFEHFALQALT